MKTEQEIDELEETIYKIMDSIFNELPKEEIYSTDIERLYAKALAKFVRKQLELLNK